MGPLCRALSSLFFGSVNQVNALCVPFAVLPHLPDFAIENSLVLPWQSSVVSLAPSTEQPCLFGFVLPNCTAIELNASQSGC